MDQTELKADKKCRKSPRRSPSPLDQPPSPPKLARLNEPSTSREASCSGSPSASRRSPKKGEKKKTSKKKLLDNVTCVFNMDETNLAGATAIIPAVSVGNVPQLTVDLIIKNAPCYKIGTFWHEAFIPVVGANPFDEACHDLCTASEVYFNDDKRIVVFQFRSPLSEMGKKEARDCLIGLCEYLEDCNVEKVVLLTSVHSHIRTDEEINDNSEFGAFRYIASPLFTPKEFEKFRICEWTYYLEGNRINYLTDDDNLCLKHVGAGFSNALYYECLGKGIPCLILLKFVFEGYNIPDAEKFLHYLDKYIKIIPDNTPIQHPDSWKVFLEDEIPPPDMY